MEDKLKLSFWRWFFTGSGGRAGFCRLLDRWVLLHLAVGIFLALLLEENLKTSAGSVLLPLVGVLVGLSFAWAGNAQALMQSSEIHDLSQYHEGGFVEYVFTYQTAILTILTSLVFWGLAGLGIFDTGWPTIHRVKWYFVVKAGLFTLSSLTIRECWHVVMGAQWMLLAQKEIRRIRQEKSK